MIDQTLGGLLNVCNGCGQPHLDILSHALETAVRRLTRAEYQIFVQMAVGPTDRQLAQMFNISLSAVKQHLQRARQKMNLDNRSQLAAASLAWSQHELCS